MDALDADLIDQLRRGSAPIDLLARVGAPEPRRAAEALLAAARQPDLAPRPDLWAPPLVRSADPAHGATVLGELVDLRRHEAPGPLHIEEVPSLPAVLGSSRFLARWVLRRPACADELRGAEPPVSADPEPDWAAIRVAKYRGLLRIAAADLSGREFRRSLGELSELADGALRAALVCAVAEVEVAEPALLALGKLGGSELNFSSDVDILFVYEPPEGTDPQEHHHAVARLVRALKSGLERHSVDGFAYRVDLDLRPEGRTGVLANPVDAALSYYEAFGAEWERQMLIRLRPVGGCERATRAFVEGVAPFVWRRHIDPEATGRVREMKLRIESERREAGRNIDFELKEGPGGIRDVEFLVQALQLFYGGRQPELRTGNVLEALEALERSGLLEPAVTASLAEGYLWLRRAEHALQLAEEQQTQRFPQDAAAQLALARRMGYADPEGASARSRMLDDWTSVRAEVRRHFDALVLGDAA